MKGDNNYNYYALQFIPDDKDIYGSSGKWNGRNTWKSWHLIPSSRPVINPPTIKANYIDIPGGNGTIDASTILTTYPLYNDREGQIEYYVTRDYDGYDSWTRVYHEVLNYLGGRTFKVIMEEDPAHYYRGRVNVNQWKSEKDWSKITLDYHLEPFKYEVLSSVDRWKWDPFSFIDGVITPEQKRMSSSDPASTVYDEFDLNNSSRESLTKPIRKGSQTLSISGTPVEILAGTMPISPTFTIRCLSNIVSGNSIPLDIYQLREYSNHYEVISKNTIEFTNSAAKTVRFYDMNIYDETGIVFFDHGDQFSNYSFKATINFRRGWL